MIAITPCFLKIHLNVIVPTMPRSSEWYLLVMLCTNSPLLLFLLVLLPPPPIKEIGRWPVPASLNSTLCMVCQELVLAPMLETFVDHLIPLELTVLSHKEYKL